MLENMTKVLTKSEIEQYFTNDEITRFQTDKTIQDKLRNLENQKEEWIKDILLEIDEPYKNYYDL